MANDRLRKTNHMRLRYEDFTKFQEFVVDAIMPVSSDANVTTTLALSYGKQVWQYLWLSKVAPSRRNVLRRVANSHTRFRVGHLSRLTR